MDARLLLETIALMLADIDDYEGNPVYYVAETRGSSIGAAGLALVHAPTDTDWTVIVYPQTVVDEAAAQLRTGEQR